jgi:signal transduction histidine kinase
MIQLIEEDVWYSDKIVNDLLDYSRDIRLDLQEISPHNLLVRSLTVCAPPERITLIDDTKDEPLVLVDVDSMKRVFGNLICNAVDAMPNGGTLEIGCKAQGNMACFTFADRGEGITEEVKQKIFQPLFTTKAKGMGFGLSICKRIIEAHRGRIEVESTVGKGSVFRIYLPIATPNSSA